MPAEPDDCLEDLPAAPYEHYIVKHPQNQFQCLTCKREGELDYIRSENCQPVESPDYLAKNPRVPFKVVAVGAPMDQIYEKAMDAEQASLQIMQEELEISEALEQLKLLEEEERLAEQKLAEANDSAKDEALPKVVGACVDQEEKAMLQEAIAISLEPAVAEVEVPGAATMPCPSSELFAMQRLADMGFTKDQAIWGVKEGGGDMDLAVKHAHWKAEADSLMARRLRLEQGARSELPAQKKPMPPPKPVSNLIATIVHFNCML